MANRLTWMRFGKKCGQSGRPDMISCLTIDASFVVKLIVPGPNQAIYEQLFADWADAGHQLYAPTLWAYEVTSALSKMARSGKLSQTFAQRSLTLAYKLDIQLMPPTPTLAESAFAWTIQLKRAASYDSFYLALAESLKCDLWTADRRLFNAASQPWVKFAGPDE
ncbi:MAG TPA: PIN domain-containing protein [Anaerolineae bacterium]|nr:PIN domain-containing protein [Anaerolineae bacterium]